MGVQIPPSAPNSYVVCSISYVVKNKALPTSKRGFEADLSACGAGKVSVANDSEGGRAWEDERSERGEESPLRHQIRM